LRAPSEFALDVAALLAAAIEPGAAQQADGSVLLTAAVTNRLVFLARLLELGTRVELLGPPQLRDQLDSGFLGPQASAGERS
jgi:predicted DNA-binding transcriptional regulator YafY